jgi:hypothetical protein
MIGKGIGAEVAMSGELPPGWPAGVAPPGAPDWERSAVAWLLDLCPPDYRGYQVLRRHPIVLARIAAQHIAAGQQATVEGLRSARDELRGLVPPEVIDEVIATYDSEAARLQAASRAVALVDDALRGGRWIPKMRG